jgi:type VI secretion system protein ImpJ
MKRFRKIVWKEGMFVTPHHFQQWDLYHEGILNSKLNATVPFNWGITHIEIDRDALVNGNIVIPALNAIMQDGTIISVPDIDQPPHSRTIGEYFQPSMDVLDVYIGLPLEKEGSPNYEIPNYKIRDASEAQENKLPRYVFEHVLVRDAVTGENEKEIISGSKNLKILFSGEVLDDFTLIKVFEITRSSTGLFSLNDKYIPPCLNISGSERLMTLLRGLIEAISAKSTSLSQQRRHKSYGAVEFGISDITHFWLLHTVNTWIPLISHYYNHTRFHPENLYRALVQFIGQLITFAVEGHPKDIAPYIHDNQGRTFESLDALARHLLEIVIPTKWVQIPLEKSKQAVWAGRVDSDKIFETSRFYVAAQGDAPEEQIRELLPKTIKIGALNDIDTIINAALPGVAISYTSRPPGSLPVKMGYQYFIVDSHSEFWDSIRKSRTIAIYVPTEFSGIRIELFALKE